MNEGFKMSVDADAQLDVELDQKTQLQRPKKYNCVLLNDDYTPMDFVVNLLMAVFNHTQEQACDVMLAIHNEGKGIAGTYSHEVASQKQNETIQLSRSHNHPLNCLVEQAE